MQEKIHAAPTLVYPESDGEPMAETGRHVKGLLDMIGAIDWLFREVPDAHVCGNMFVYYEEGNPRKVISPDVFMVRGVGKKELRTYKTWEQQPHLDLVIEFASPSTFARDFAEKKQIYEQILQVKEYYIYDPYHEIQPSFVGFRLVDGTYEEIEFVEGRLSSEVLGLELGERDGVLRLYDPVKQKWFGPPREHLDEVENRLSKVENSLSEVENSLSEAETRASEAENRIAEEVRARRDAEAELEKLRAALQRLEATE